MARKGFLVATVLSAFVLAVLLVSTGCQSEYEKHYQLAKQLKNEERYKEAIKEYELAAQADPTQAKPYYRIGQIYKKLDEQDSAAEYFRKAIQVDPDYVAAYPELVKALRRAGELDKAAQVARDALAKPVVRRDVEAVREIEEQMAEIEKERKARQEKLKQLTKPAAAPTTPGKSAQPTTSPVKPKQQ